MKPSGNVCKIDAYPDADFAGMYGHEEHTYPACTKSWTGFIMSCLLAVQATDRDGSTNNGSQKSQLLLHAADGWFSDKVCQTSYWKNYHECLHT